MTKKYLNAALTENLFQTLAHIFRDYRDEIDSKMLIDDEHSEDRLMSLLQRTDFSYEEPAFPLLRRVIKAISCDELLYSPLQEDDLEYFLELGLIEEQLCFDLESTET